VNRAVLAYVRQLEDEAILCVANISRSAQAVELDMSPWKGRIPQEMLGRTKFPRIGELPYLVTLPPYGFFWFSLLKEAKQEPEKVLPQEITTLVLAPGWDDDAPSWTRRTFEVDVLPSFMPDRRWFADKGARPLTTKVSTAIRLEHANDRFGIVIADVKGPHGVSRYFLPLSIRWTRYTAIDRGPASLLAAVRRGSREGVLLDATAEPEFISALLAKISAEETIKSDGSRIEFRPTASFASEAPAEIKEVTAIAREQSNSSVIVDHRYVVKILRRITLGIHPEIEVGRFLADVAHFENAPRLLGSVELVENEERSALAVVHAYIQNQGDAWSVTSNALDRLVEEQRLTAAETIADTLETATMLHRMQQIGLRTAEMHRAFACSDEIPAFAPEPITGADAARWTDNELAHAQTMFAQIERSFKELQEPAALLAQRLLDHRAAILDHVEAGRNESFCDGVKIRHHGDFHLGQVLIAKDDAYILDFEGEPRRTLEERRAKAPAARDVAGLLRSIDYAMSAAIARAPDLSGEDRAALGQRLHGWTEQMSAAYWESYREALGDERRLWPADENQMRRLLDRFLLEKAMYEVEYEFANRPAWVHIPLEATLRILQQREVIGP
jgi:maltose alpha-D-glucosyltransferase/alpha-amylase